MLLIQLVRGLLLDRFPLSFPLRTCDKNPLRLLMWPKCPGCLCFTDFNRFLSVPILCKTSSFVTLSFQLIPPILRRHHISNASILFSNTSVQMVLKQQYLGKRKKCGNAARNTSFLAVLVKYLGHFEFDLDAFWHEITFWSCEGCKTSIFGKTQKMWQRCTENVNFSRFSQISRPFRNWFGCLLAWNYILVKRRL